MIRPWRDLFTAATDAHKHLDQMVEAGPAWTASGRGTWSARGTSGHRVTIVEDASGIYHHLVTNNLGQPVAQGRHDNLDAAQQGVADSLARLGRD